jgi:hypothetical protein
MVSNSVAIDASGSNPFGEGFGYTTPSQSL